MKRLLCIIFGLGFLFVSGMTLAASPPGIDTLTPAMSNVTVPDTTGADLFTPSLADKSMNYLGQVFGTVGGVVHGTSGELLAQLFKVFNYAMVVIACLIMIYTVIVSVVNTAQEGEFMGKKMNSTWVIFRCVAGMGILVPKYTGYSMIQVFIMWVTVQGIGLADKTWAQALTYISNAGGVYSVPANVANMGDTVTAAGNIFQSEECMYALQNIANADKQQAMQDLKSDPTNPTLMMKAIKPLPNYRPVWNDDAKTVSFGFQSNNPDSVKVCGVYSWKKTGNQPDIYEQYKRAGLEQVVMTLSEPAKTLVDAADQASSQTKAQENSLEQTAIGAIVGAAADYTNIMKPAVDGAQEQANIDWKANVKAAKAEGWIVAGDYYSDLAKINNDLQNSTENAPPTGTGMVSNMSDYGVDTDALKKKMDYVSKYVNMDDISKDLQILESANISLTPDQLGSIIVAVYENGGNVEDMAKVLSQNGNTNGGQGSTYNSPGKDDGLFTTGDITGASAALGATTAAAAGATAMSPGVGSLFLVLSGSMTALFLLWVHQMNAPGDPIAMVQVLGQGMVAIAVSVWIIGSVVLGISTAVASVGTSATGIGYGIQNSLKLFVPIVIGFVGVLFVNGMILSVYVPLIPFMIFTFAAIGWLISVLEAIVAGPLVALGITHPEGHDLLGKAEQAVMLLMGVFLRPVIMVIGFLAAMVLARVTLRLVNEGFAHAASAADITSSGYNIFATMGLMIVYTMIVISLINLVFNAGVVKLWENIWMWIGGHQPSSSVESVLQEVRGGLHAGAQTMSDVGGGMTKATGESLANVIDAKQKEGGGGTQLANPNGGGNAGANPKGGGAQGQQTQQQTLQNAPTGIV